ncbi:hypothetical protein [Escherichia coli]|uniref:hypothetical protein n=1 Tax=Escherichia coli TaxID=562 RepID=UPI00293BDBC9|nr:hypothetical protein [Escherichia coli]
MQGTHGGGPGKKSAILLGERGLAQAWLRRMSADNAGGVIRPTPGLAASRRATALRFRR